HHLLRSPHVLPRQIAARFERRHLLARQSLAEGISRCPPRRTSDRIRRRRRRRRSPHRGSSLLRLPYRSSSLLRIRPPPSPPPRSLSRPRRNRVPGPLHHRSTL